MATATITLQSVCAGGDHARVSVQVNGGPTRTFEYAVDELRDNITADQVRDAALVMMRLHCQGMTKAQARAALQAGIDVTTVQ